MRGWPLWLPVAVFVLAGVGTYAATEWRSLIHSGRDVAGEVVRFVDSGTGGDSAGAVQARFVKCVDGRPRNCVIDGDTIRYEGVKIRLEDINAPETYSPHCPAEKALGDMATRRLIDLINEAPFELIATGGRDEDRYGRKLRVLARNGRSLGDILVAEGLARPWSGRRRSWCD